MSKSDSINLNKVFFIENQLTTVYLEYFGGRPFIHVEVGDYSHIYFRQLREFHTVGTWDDMDDEYGNGLITKWLKHGLSYNSNSSCLMTISNN